MHNGDTEAKEVRPWAERRRIFIFASSASKAANELVRFPDPLTKSGCLQKSWTRQSTTMLVVGVRLRESPQIFLWKGEYTDGRTFL